MLSGCAPTPTPKPKPSASPSATATPTPTPEPVVEPEAAFDVSCEDVAATMAGLVGEPSTPVEPVLSVVSGPNWYPGPAQYMFQRAGGIACSAGDVNSDWEISIVPGAHAVMDGAARRDGFWGEEARCEPSGYCVLQIVEGEVLLSATVHDPALGEADGSRLDESLRALAATAAASVREFELADSQIVGAECERFLTFQELAEVVGGETRIVDTFGGWGISAEVYEVVNGSEVCLYTDGGDQYSGTHYFTLTTLPAGAWAFERTPGAPAEVEGADAAKVGTDAYGATALDLRVGLDWIRLTSRDVAAETLTVLAEKIVRNVTVGHTAPQ